VPVSLLDRVEKTDRLDAAAPLPEVRSGQRAVELLRRREVDHDPGDAGVLAEVGDARLEVGAEPMAVASLNPEGRHSRPHGQRIFPGDGVAVIASGVTWVSFAVGTIPNCLADGPAALCHGPDP
jgi:hypothetical protein